MKKLWTGIMITAVMAATSQVSADLYNEDFSTDPGFAAVNGLTAIGATGSLGTYFAFGEYNGSDGLGVTTSTGVLHIDTNDRANRNRGLSVFIDTSAAAAGTYTVSFDVLNFVAGTGTTPGYSGFKVFEGSGLDTGHITLDNIDNDTSPAVPRRDKSSTAAVWTDLGNTWGAGTEGSGISANGTVSFDVELTEAGVAGDYLALAWVQQMLDIEAPSFDVDNISVTIPEPATLGMIASFGVGVLFIRRRIMM
ncbi:hypothetical protein [Pontiella sulfatireligans]|uniref:PEP-CTERM protein-sorting domain-containing protein n=1 Tax=Pontiella sulfatireligans TaxID=2750658 RepID=A0A6C2UDU5_9BACT|nr:hypothetical protein [Pontiella sulfatireligans]VGO18382.1 hypothetical protein SCARR_00434 [Pontiella sulfatireligans]